MSENPKAISIKDQPKIKVFLPALVLVPSFYYSFSFTSGVLIGYIVAKVFYNVLVQNGKVNPIFIDWGKWKFHLHHWMTGAAFLGIVWMVDFFYVPTIFAGVVCGIIIHDIYDFNDWYEIIVRQEVKVKNK